jgi:putative membrane protein
MLRRDHLPHLLGAATLAVLFGAASVHPQATTGSAGSPAGATKNAAPSTGGAPAATGQAGGGAGAADKSTTGTQSAPGKQLSKADAGMMRDMAYTNISEVATAKIAQEKSKNEHVQSYAKQMIDDHSKAENELQQLAQTKGVTLPAEPDKKHQAAAKKLSALSGDAFDRAYMKQAGIQDHTDARKLLMRVKDKATDADVKAAADKMLPTVEQHLKMAKEMPVGKSGASSASGASGTTGGAGAGAPSKPDTSSAPGGAGK